MKARNIARGRLYWVLSDIRHMLRNLRPPEGQSYPVRYELGWGWTVRSNHGWRRFPMVTPPLHWTRRIPADAQTAAEDWAMDCMGIS
ncbi:hypothetical protein [Nocardia iowensis]|uniref:Uncharacterized protein n=1 Tax=Nocardia iowensis TaxID=204891 RepID=A0ABX8RJZ3_NOCIO|nr:hypothetical protein [Nocardia iowensis]QXN88740.1 hypothetical protein KV110_24470 [Nocardia iowensis]